MHVTHDATDLPPTVAEFMRDFDRSVIRQSLVRAAGIAASVFVLCALACLGVDRVWHLSSHVRLALLAANCIASGAIIVRAVWTLRREIDWIATAGEIERKDPRFDQRLMTVVSQFAGPRDLRGSEEILSHILIDVESHISSGDAPTRPVLWRAAIPWLVCAGIAGALIVMSGGLAPQLPQLAVRFVMPLADVPPVTTTQIRVLPGNHDVIQSEPLRIDADVEHLRGDSVWLFLNTQGDWYRVAMEPTDAGHYGYTLSSVDRDVRYYVAAGDAITPRFLVRVLRPPIVSEFQLSYEFPAYVRQMPMTVTNNDGRIEAPVGSNVTLTIICSEPLQSALLVVGSSKIPMSRTDNDAIRRATITIRRDSSYSIDLVSAREVPGEGPAGMRIHVLLNRPPKARLLRGEDDLRLTPRDIAVLSYEASDDYALSSLSLRVRVNAAPSIDRPISLLANHRGQRGSAALDLASLPLKIGDVLSVSMVATDYAGQTTVSDPLHIAISARSVDLDAQQRVVELGSAAEFAAALTNDFQAAEAAVAPAGGTPGKSPTALAVAAAQANLALTNASESATLLRQSLCRVMLHTHDGALCAALAGWIDGAEIQSETADELFRQRGDTSRSEREIDSELKLAVARGRELSDAVRVAARSQRAANVLADRQDVSSQSKRPRATARDAEALRLLGISAESDDVDAQLHARIEEGEKLTRGAKPIDFAAAAYEWAGELQRGERAAGLKRRLGAAAEAEAVRPDADLVKARDLQLASRAAGAIETSLAQKQPDESSAASIVESFATALAALQRGYELRAAGSLTHADEETSAAAAASAARLRMTNWAPDAGDVASAPASKRVAEDLAFQASAATASKNYDQAGHLDEVLLHRLAETPAVPGGSRREVDGAIEQGRQEVAQSMAAARALDGIGQTQDAVAHQTQAADTSRISDLAGAERKVTAAIAAMVAQRSGSSDANSRDRAAASFLEVQTELASLPQKLADAQVAGAALHAAAGRAAVADADEARLAPSAPEDEKGMAHRAAEEADNDADEAAERLRQALGPIDADEAIAWADQLAPFAPESTAACEVLRSQLAASLSGLSGVLQAGDPVNVDRAAAKVRSAIEAAQKELAAGQDALTDRDPLSAAKSFAGAAAESLAQSPPDVSGAVRQQVRATGALARAWDQSIHDAAMHRLEIVPSMQSLYDPASYTGAPARSAEVAGGWGNLQSHEPEPLNLVSHDSDPAGYEDSLRIYFQALAKAQAARNEEHPAN